MEPIAGWLANHIATAAPPQPPPAPTGLAATPGNTQVFLTWNASSGATSYKVKRSTTSGGPYTIIAPNVTTTDYLDTGLTNGTAYYYVVSAVNAVGESANSSQVSATPSTTVVAEDFNSMPAWSSTFDAAWGAAATWSIVSGGQSGTALQAQRGNAGSSAKVKVYTITPNTSYTVSVYIRCPSSSAYWAETALKLGSFSAEDFDTNSATWTLIKKFSDTGTNGNGDVWTQYSATFNAGSNTQVSIGYKLGSSSGTGPIVRWDTLRVLVAASAPTIDRSPATLSPSCTQGTNATGQSFTVRNSGTGTLNYTIADNATWLSVSPSTGTSTGETDTINVTYATSSLAAGT